MFPQMLHNSTPQTLHYYRSPSPATWKITAKPWGELDISASWIKNDAFTTISWLPHLLDFPILVSGHGPPKKVKVSGYR